MACWARPRATSGWGRGYHVRVAEMPLDRCASLGKGPWRANLGAEVRARIVPAIGNLAQETGDFRPLWPLDVGVPVSNVYSLYPLGRRLLFLICSRPLAPHFPQLRTLFSFLQDLGFPLYFFAFLNFKLFFFLRLRKGGPALSVALQQES